MLGEDISQGVICGHFVHISDVFCSSQMHFVIELCGMLMQHSKAIYNCIQNLNCAERLKNNNIKIVIFQSPHIKL